MKSWPYWVKGGVVGASITVFFVIVTYVYAFVPGLGGDWSLLAPLYFSILPSLPIFELLFPQLSDSTLTFTLMQITSAAILFVVGAMIGFIFDYMSKRS